VGEWIQILEEYWKIFGVALVIGCFEQQIFCKNISK